MWMDTLTHPEDTGAFVKKQNKKWHCLNAAGRSSKTKSKSASRNFKLVNGSVFVLLMVSYLRKVMV